MKLSLTDEEYFNRKEISASDLKLLKKTVGHYLGKNEINKESKSLEFGKLFHSMILEPNKFENDFVCAPDIDGRSKEYKDFILFNGNKNIIKYDDFQKLLRMKAKLLKSDKARKIFGKGESESVYISEIEVESNSGIKLGKFGVRCKVDHITEVTDENGNKKTIVFDLKTCQDASFIGFRNAINKYNYHIQGKHYLNVLKSCGINADIFAFICVETDFPHHVGLYALSRESLNHAQAEINECFKKLYDYNNQPEDKKFDGYCDEFQEIDLPDWRYNQEI